MIEKKRFEKSRHATYNIGYHLIWCPKYRRRVLVGRVEERLKEVLKETAAKNHWNIETMEVMPDHIHIFVKSHPMDSPCEIVARFKGASANILRKEFKELRSKLPTLWTRSYYCESIGHISAATITRYIDEQKTK